MMKRKNFVVVCTVSFLILGLLVSPNFFVSAEALRGQGISSKNFGKNTEEFVCGDKLCSELKNIEKEEQAKKELQERIQKKIEEMKSSMKAPTQKSIQSTMETKDTKIPYQTYVILSKFPTSKIIEVIPYNGINISTVIFQVCASSEVTMRAPEVIITSDSEIKNLRLHKVIPKDTCTQTNSSIISSDPKSITIQVIDKSKLNIAAEKVETQIKNLENEIADTNNQLQAKLKSFPKDWSSKSFNYNEINEIVSKLSDLRKESDKLKLEYYDLIYALKPNN